ncbi:MAG TPA: CYTH domain-containing protein [Candidatus Corynebacterium avicola]|uniref:CYTH domain-containing protein n=1 Tax=Candidatus Corynebacterium avicola TaxID=2838527 RepID=A0A9D1UM67_9CORY|nr:CYTH domain-containing protein [Candidatus Corynebacterium avicola]
MNIRPGVIRRLAATTALLATGAGLAPSASAADVADVEGYQVKLRVDDVLVDSSGDLTSAALDLFNLSEEDAESGAEVERSLYVDTEDKDFDAAGWSLRLRHKEGEDAYDLTYKYRQDLADNTLSSDSVDQALTDAADANFDSSDDNYEAQVNASYSTSTLDFSNQKSTDCPDSSCDLEDDADSGKAVELLDDKLPGKFEKALGTTLEDADASASQVVTQRTWPVTVDTEDGGIEADLEVTEMSGGYFVEVTAETEDREDAADVRDALEAALDEEGFLRQSDAFKTSLVLDGRL